MKTILVVDDEPKIAALARDYLEHAGFAVITASTGRAALDSVRRQRPDRGPGDDRAVIRAGELVLDPPRMRVELGDRQIDLTPTEFQLLATLAGQPGRIFTRSQLLDALHGIAFESYERAIDTHIKNIRRKLEPDPRVPRHVLTVYGVGYRFADDRP
jgi:DNA-binding response OmpR family regulator